MDHDVQVLPLGFSGKHSGEKTCEDFRAIPSVEVPPGICNFFEMEKKLGEPVERP